MSVVACNARDSSIIGCFLCQDYSNPDPEDEVRAKVDEVERDHMERCAVLRRHVGISNPSLSFTQYTGFMSALEGDWMPCLTAISECEEAFNGR